MIKLKAQDPLGVFRQCLNSPASNAIISTSVVRLADSCTRRQELRRAGHSGRALGRDWKCQVQARLQDKILRLWRLTRPCAAKGK